MATSPIASAASNDTSATAGTASSTIASASASPSDLSSMFLKLLVTQLEHQDPTQPQDSSQLVTQLAQFASLEQLTGIHEAVTALTDSLQTAAPQSTNSQQ